MYYRIAILLQEKGQLDARSTWQWKSTTLSSLDSLFQVLRLYRALPQDHLRVFSSTSPEGLKEQLMQENRDFCPSSVTAGQFLQARMIQLSGSPLASGESAHEGTTSIAVTSRRVLEVSNGVAHALEERSMSLLERRRLELELGTESDHDITYSFCLPLSLPQVLAWVRLMSGMQRGELQP